MLYMVRQWKIRIKIRIVKNSEDFVKYTSIHALIGKYLNTI